MLYQSRITTTVKRTTLVLVLITVCGFNSLAARDSEMATASTDVATAVVLQEPSPTPAPVQMTQVQQGRSYGQPGFMGEPINLNVVNADIRDILNYITEQYGVNFVIDSSVAAVPVTVNVQDVPWNLALDAVLKANRLGIESNGNILRVATTEVLAKEADTQKILNDSRLDASDRKSVV